MSGKDQKFDPNTDIPDLSGKVYVVTGGSAGIGKYTIMKSEHSKAEFSTNEAKATASAPTSSNTTVPNSTSLERKKSTSPKPKKA